MIALYFKSRKNFQDKSTWEKEELPEDYTNKEVLDAAKLAGCEGVAIIANFDKANHQVKLFKWFVA